MSRFGDSDLQRLTRCAKGMSAAFSAQADAMRDLGLVLRAMRVARELGDDAPPASWEVERHAFIVREVRWGA